MTQSQRACKMAAGCTMALPVGQCSFLSSDRTKRSVNEKAQNAFFKRRICLSETEWLKAGGVR